MTTRPGDPLVTSLDMPERFDLASEVPTDDRLAAIRALLPEVIREGKVDFDALRRSLGDWVDPGPERFGLTWPGKAECMRVIQQPSLGTLVPMPEESADWDSTQNVIIEGDNLEVLKLLQKAYYGKVKLIYIDPPYNTGNEFIYPDNFREGLTDYLRYSGQTDEHGLKLSANAETDGRYHSKWLSMMYPRLFLARNLLRDDGVVFVSIDDHEAHNLRALMNEIFGEENFVATVIWQKVYSPMSSSTQFSPVHDYILVYARTAATWTPNLLPRTAEQDTAYKNPDSDPRGPWKAENFTVPAGHATPTQFYKIVSPAGNSFMPPTGRAWVYTEPRYREFLADNRVWFGQDGTGRPAIKRFLTEVKQGRVAQTLWPYDEVGHNQDAKKELLKLVDFASSETVFDTPKPTKLIRRMLALATDADSSDVVMDFFAGSGSMADAVLQQNAEDGGDRRYVMVQLPEPTGDVSMPTISAIARKRAEAAAARIREKPENLLTRDPADLGFRSYRLSSSNFAIWDASATADQLERQLELSVQHLTEGATEASMLTELLLKAGYPLASPVESLDFAGIPGYSVADGALIVCLSKALSIPAFEAMVDREPVMILVLDAGFGGSDELKVNALQTVRARNQSTGSDIALRVV
jgi:adenine-specific DNA-methyltransferase